MRRPAIVFDHVVDLEHFLLIVGEGPTHRFATKLSGTLHLRNGFGAMRKLLLSLVLLAGCSKGPEADLQYIKQARSAGAEWALVNEQASKGKLTAAYVGSMHEWLRDEIEASSTALSRPDSPYGLEIQALLHQPDDAAPDELRAHADKLKQIEDQLESA
jgi:hypothetical protein